MTNFEKVGTFMKTFGQEVKLRPSMSSAKINKLRFTPTRANSKGRREDGGWRGG